MKQESRPSILSLFSGGGLRFIIQKKPITIYVIKCWTSFN